MGSELRLTIQAQRVLSVFLAHPDEHRYGLELAQSAGLPTGSVYPILTRLERAGWLESDWEAIDPVAEGRRPRRYYRLTRTGLVGARQSREAARRWLFGETVTEGA
jgi:PadR family transcriptional regulator, regulatory protein PadR